jgi:hypothetical protein
MPVFVCVLAVATAPTAGAFRLPATQTYALSRHIEVAAVALNLPTGVNDLGKLEAAVRTGCPQALSAAPLGAEHQDLEEEARWDVTLTATWPLREPVVGFASAQIDDELHWKNRRLNNAMHVYFHELFAYFQSRPTNLCHDIGEWEQGRYRTLPSGTSAFLAQLHRFRAHSHGVLVLVRNRLLPRTATAAERRLLKRAERTEGAQAERLNPKLEATATALQEALGGKRTGAPGPVVPTLPTVESEPA